MSASLGCLFEFSADHCPAFNALAISVTSPSSAIFLRISFKITLPLAKAPPSDKQWEAFYSRFMLLLVLYERADDGADQVARSLLKEMNSLWVFLEENGVEPTNNRADRALRFGVIWRKRSNGTRWVEHILSIKQTCRIKSQPVFQILVDAISAYFTEQKPTLGWLTA